MGASVRNGCGEIFGRRRAIDMELVVRLGFETRRADDVVRAGRRDLLRTDRRRDFDARVGREGDDRLVGPDAEQLWMLGDVRCLRHASGGRSVRTAAMDPVGARRAEHRGGCRVSTR